MKCKIISGAAFLLILLICPVAAMCKTVRIYTLPPPQYYSRDFSAFPKWTRIVQSMDNESLISFYGLSRLKNRPPSDLAPLINDAINSYQFIEDEAAWGMGDYWQTPAEFAISGGGDCEDFAITKYFLLQKLGIPEERMNIMVAYDKHRRQLHALLILNTDEDDLILDSQQSTTNILTGMARYIPIYSFNRIGWQSY